MSSVPFSGRDRGTSALPRFTVRAWEGGGVFGDVDCPCGASVFDDERQSLTDTGHVRLECPDCHRVYVVQVLCHLVLVPAAVRGPGDD